MKVVLYMAMTANGMIATDKDETPWSDAVWKSYYKIAKQFKAAIFGRRTYDIMKSVNEFEKIGNPFTVFLSKNSRVCDSNVVSTSTPQEAVDLLKQKKFKTAFLGGGSQANAAFMKAGLVDEIIIDLEPMIFGKGIKLFADEDFQAKLKLIGTKKLSKDEIQLRYKVVKRKND